MNREFKSYKKMREIDISQRPREKLVKYGFESLKNEELLAILLGSGTKEKNVLDLSKYILEHFGDKELLNATVEELCSIKGIGIAKACTIIAALQLGKRITKNILNRKITKVNSSSDCYNLVKEDFSLSDKEHFIAILLNIKNDIISTEVVSVGDLNSTVVNPREVFKPCVKKSAKKVIICHNHPSGNPRPSYADRKLTNRLIEAGAILDIEVLDHIIIGHNCYYSLSKDMIIKGDEDE